MQLVAAWDQLAMRLPPQTGVGRGGQLILEALKVAVAYAPPAPAAAAPAAGSPRPAEPQLSRPLARALSLASRLADLAAAGLPVDAESIAAGILAEVLLAGAHTPGAWHPPPAPAGSSAESSSSSGGSGSLNLQVIEERVGPIVAQLVHDVQRARQLPARVELLDDTAARWVLLSCRCCRPSTTSGFGRFHALAGAAPSHGRRSLDRCLAGQVHT